MVALPQSEVPPAKATRYFVSVMQVIIALPWLMLDHPAYGGPAMVVWLAIGAVATRQAQRIPHAVVSRARARHIPVPRAPRG